MFENTMGAPMGFNGYGAPMMQYSGFQPQQAPKFNNLLTEEQIKHLQSNKKAFSFGITQDDHLRALCNHRSADGLSDTLVQTADGTYVCSICGCPVNPVDPATTKEQIEASIEDVVNVLQTIKLLYRDFPTDAADGFFDIIPLMEKIPALFDLASKSMQEYERMGNPYYNANNSVGALTALQSLGNLFGVGGMAGMQPMMGGVPQMTPPMGNMNMGMAGANPAFAQQNAFGYPGASMNPGYQPGTTGFQYNPGVAPQPATPTPAPVATETKTESVQA